MDGEIGCGNGRLVLVGVVVDGDVAVPARAVHGFGHRDGLGGLDFGHDHYLLWWPSACGGVHDFIDGYFPGVTELEGVELSWGFRCWVAGADDADVGGDVCHEVRAGPVVAPLGTRLPRADGACCSVRAGV